MNLEEPKVAVSLSEIISFHVYAMVIMLIAVGMYAVAPRGLGQAMGIAFAVGLIPLPAIVLYFTRWRKVARGGKT